MNILNKLINNIMNRWKKREYKIVKTNDKYIIYKKLAEYNNSQDAVKDMSELITNKITEVKIMKEGK